MEIFVNDAPVSCEEGATVSEVLAQEGITPVNIAVAVNESVVPKSQWEATKLTAERAPAGHQSRARRVIHSVNKERQSKIWKSLK